jgi:hypothetical protein
LANNITRFFAPYLPCVSSKWTDCSRALKQYENLLLFITITSNTVLFFPIIFYLYYSLRLNTFSHAKTLVEQRVLITWSLSSTSRVSRLWRTYSNGSN